MELTLETPCKINLRLDVGEKLPNGFHKIESVFLALNLTDSLTFKTSPRGGSSPFLCGVHMTEEGFSGFLKEQFKRDLPPPENNLIHRAAVLFAKNADVPFNLDVFVKKRIPSAAGLGGASSNCAAALCAVNELCGKPFKTQDLSDLAAEIGSDAPFFVHALYGWGCESCSPPDGTEDAAPSGAWAYAEGRGELLAPIPPLIKERFWTVLAHPGFSSSTAKAYKMLDDFRLKSGGDLAFKSYPPFLNAGEEGGAVNFFNSFLPVFLSQGEQEERRGYKRMLLKLKEKNPAFYGLSGSGSVCFAVFLNEAGAVNAQKDLLESGFWANIALPWGGKPFNVRKD
ncbi:MAG: hypothetical protein LBC53_09020 [Spirochaetaceae bacterium]|jgi:4-diphosphocytidyl-2-C-methyl-D-erythritol kinase|nr:hypothetical protein [Spirochaetaceae bacterium]